MIKRLKRIATKVMLKVDTLFHPTRAVIAKVDNRYDFFETTAGVGSISVFFKIKYNQNGNRLIKIVGSSKNTDGTKMNDGWHLSVDTLNGKLWFWNGRYGSAGNNYWWMHLNTNIKEGVLYHVVITKNGYIDYNCFVNGVEVPKGEYAATGDYYSNSYPITFGGTDLLEAVKPKGEIEVAHFAIFNKILNLNDAENIYDLGGFIPKNLHANCIGYWPMQEKRGKIRRDAVKQFNYAKVSTTFIPLSGYGTVGKSFWGIDNGNYQVQLYNVGWAGYTGVKYLEKTYTLPTPAKVTVQVTVHNWIGKIQLLNPDNSIIEGVDYTKGNEVIIKTFKVYSGQKIRVETVSSITGYGLEYEGEIMAYDNFFIDSETVETLGLTPNDLTLLTYENTELVANSDFSQGAAYWNVDDPSAWVIDNTGAYHKPNNGVDSPASVHYMYQNKELKHLGLYEVEIHITGDAYGARVWLNGFGGYTIQRQDENGIVNLPSYGDLGLAVGGVYKGLMYASNYGQIVIGSQASPVAFKITKFSVKPYLEDVSDIYTGKPDTSLGIHLKSDEGKFIVKNGNDFLDFGTNDFTLEVDYCPIEDNYGQYPCLFTTHGNSNTDAGVDIHLEGLGALLRVVDVNGKIVHFRALNAFEFGKTKTLRWEKKTQDWNNWKVYADGVELQLVINATLRDLLTGSATASTSVPITFGWDYKQGFFGVLNRVCVSISGAKKAEWFLNNFRVIDNITGLVATHNTYTSTAQIEDKLRNKEGLPELQKAISVDGGGITINIPKTGVNSYLNGGNFSIYYAGYFAENPSFDKRLFTWQTNDASIIDCRINRGRVLIYMGGTSSYFSAPMPQTEGFISVVISRVGYKHLQVIVNGEILMLEPVSMSGGRIGGNYEGENGFPDLELRDNDYLQILDVEGSYGIAVGIKKGFIDAREAVDLHNNSGLGNPVNLNDWARFYQMANIDTSGYVKDLTGRGADLFTAWDSYWINPAHPQYAVRPLSHLRAPLKLPLGSLGILRKPKMWFDIADWQGVSSYRHDYYEDREWVTEVANKGWLQQPFITPYGDALTVDVDGVNKRYLAFDIGVSAGSGRLTIGTPADAKFLHDGTQYLVVILGAGGSNGGGLYSTAPYYSATPVTGTNLFTGFWGSSWNNAMTKVWNPNFIWTSAPEVVERYKFNITSEIMRGYNVTSGNQYEMYLNGGTTPIIVKNDLNTVLAGTENTNPDWPLSLGILSGTENGSDGRVPMLKQALFFEYPAGTNPSVIESDRVKVVKALNDIYRVY